MADHIPVRNLAMAETHKVVSITSDGRTRIVTTDVDTVEEVLDRASISVGANDLVEPAPQTALPNGFFNVNVYRAEVYRVLDGEQSKLVTSAHRSPRLIAEDAGIKLYPEDEADASRVQDFVSAPAVGQQVVIKRATPITLSADGKTDTVRSHASSVGKLLADAGIQLGSKDTIQPALDAPIVNGITVSITRVTDTDVDVTEVIPFTSKTVTDPNQPKGVSIVQVAGVNGRRQVSYRIHYENGVEKSRIVLAVTGQQEPVNQIVVAGTKVAFSGSIEHWRPFVLESAARWGVDPNLMLAIMHCESRGDANASNGSHFGLYQYSAATWKSYGHPMSTIFDGPAQIEATAGRLAQKNATAPWLASKSCWSKMI